MAKLQKKKAQTHGQGLGRGLAGFWPNCKKQWKKKTKKTKSSDPCPQPGLSPDLAHGSELFVFFVFFGFLEVSAKLQKTMEKKKKTKSSDPCPQPGLSPDLAHGSELFVFFLFFFFFDFFCMFFMRICFHHSTSQKMRVSTICTPAPPRPNCKKTWKTKLHLMTYIMTNIMTLYIY